MAIDFVKGAAVLRSPSGVGCQGAFACCRSGAHKQKILHMGGLLSVSDMLHVGLVFIANHMQYDMDPTFTQWHSVKGGIHL